MKSRYQLQDQKKNEKSQTNFNPLPIETKNKFKIEMDSMPTIKKPEQLKQKAQAPIGQARRVYTNTEVISERLGGTFKLLPVKVELLLVQSSVQNCLSKLMIKSD